MSVALASFAVFAASQVGTPGPANMALMGTGARFGFRAALPFVGGVVLGKQLIIWPLGLGLMIWLRDYPVVFGALRWAAIAYIFWLAWKVANTRIAPGEEGARVPGLVAGLWVHPLNPKAWAMIIGGFTNFVGEGTSAIEATFGIALVLFACQVVLHPMWALAGDRVARLVAGTRAETYLMWTLAALTVLSVLYVLLGGGEA